MKICVVRIDKMGDMLLTLPVIKGLKKLDEKNIVDVVCSESNFKICNKVSIINNIFLFNKRISKISRIIKQIRKENYDRLYTFSPGWISIMISIFSKSKLKSLLILESRYKPGASSKIIEKIISKLFFDHIKIIDRNSYFQKNKSIHQSTLMQKLVRQSGLNIMENEKINNLFHFNKKNYNQKEICLIHLSSKWINRYFSEDNFINLLKNLKNFGKNIVMSSDESSMKVFTKIFKKYKKINNKDFNSLEDINEILILDQLDFDNWGSIISSAKYVITPECGCTHVASLANCKLCVIYDADNLPEMISQEYAPWRKNYTKLIFNDKKLEEKLLSFSN